MAADAYREIMRLAGDDKAQPLSVAFEGQDPVHPTCIRAGDAAAGALAATAAMAQEIGAARGLARQAVRVDVRAAAASLLGFLFQRLKGRDVPRPALANPTIGIYRAACGRYIHLHGGFPHLRDGILRLLDCEADPAAIAAAVGRWDAGALEDALAYVNLCGAVVRARAEWELHPQGRALARAPVVAITRIGDAPPLALRPAPNRPLERVRVLDMTRVLAGPACGRTLAAHGADVLRIGALHLPTIEPFVLDTGHGKRFAALDFADREDAETLADLIGKSHVFVQSYRPGALARHGLGPQDIAERRPGIVCVSVNCYGHDGPFADRAGWEQLAQGATGMARVHTDDLHGEGAPPDLVPAEANNYTTGYLAAFGALAALRRQAREGGSWHVRVSLARTATWMMDLGTVNRRRAQPVTEEEAERLSDTRDTPLGSLRFLRPAESLSVTPPHWDLPPAPIGSSPAAWRTTG